IRSCLRFSPLDWGTVPAGRGPRRRLGAKTSRARRPGRLGPPATPATPGSTATVTALGSDVQRGQSATSNFWQNHNGQALINSFNGGPGATILANWLAFSFASLYGVNAAAHNLTGKTAEAGCRGAGDGAERL